MENPDENDLIDTALTIAQSYEQSLESKYNDLIQSLAKAYYEIKLLMKEKISLFLFIKNNFFTLSLSQFSTQ